MASKDDFDKIFHQWIEIFMGRSMRNFMHFAKDNGLSMSQIGALIHIKKASCGVSRISDDLGVTHAATSQMLERLVQQGLILRSEDTHDRRAKQIVLTEKGQHTLRACLLARQDWLERLANTLSEGEKRKVMDGLAILIEKSEHLESEIVLDH
jgi:DNA-binding MarR family transcriptional regulator